MGPCDRQKRIYRYGGLRCTAVAELIRVPESPEIQFNESDGQSSSRLADRRKSQ